MDEKTHRYYCVNRPPGISCQPDGCVARETWLPARKVGDRLFLGFVEYTEPLATEQIWKFELWPGDEVERAKSVFYNEEEWLRASYMDYDEAFLEESAGRDRFAWAALVLKRK